MNPPDLSRHSGLSRCQKPGGRRKRPKRKQGGEQVAVDLLCPFLIHAERDRCVGTVKICFIRSSEVQINWLPSGNGLRSRAFLVIAGRRTEQDTKLKIATTVCNTQNGEQ